MTQVKASATLADGLIAGSADWYAGRRIPKEFAGLPRSVLDHLIAETGGDWRRCVVEQDGTVTVYNAPIWERTT